MVVVEGLAVPPHHAVVRATTALRIMERLFLFNANAHVAPTIKRGISTEQRRADPTGCAGVTDIDQVKNDLFTFPPLLSVLIVFRGGCFQMECEL